MYWSCILLSFRSYSSVSLWSLKWTLQIFFFSCCGFYADWQNRTYVETIEHLYSILHTDRRWDPRHPPTPRCSRSPGIQNLDLTLLLMGCFYPYIWWRETDSVHPLSIRKSNRIKTSFGIFFWILHIAKFLNLQGCLRTWCPLDHTLRHPWKCQILTVKIILKKAGQYQPPPLKSRAKQVPK